MVTIGLAGHVCADLVPELTAETAIVPGQLLEVGPLTIAPGGCVANTGTALANSGIEVSISACIGDDDLGRILRQLLTDRGFDSDGLIVTAGTATSYSIVIEKPGMNRSFWHHVGANAVFDGRDVAVDRCDMLHLGYPPLLPALTANAGAPLVALLGRARSAGVTTSLDMAVVDPASPAGRIDWADFFARILPLTDVFSPSIDDLTSALGHDPDESPAQIADRAAQLVDLGAGVVVISAGERGLFLKAASAERLARGGRIVAPLAGSWADAQLWVPAAPVDRVGTTNGAGDAASAGLLHGLADGLAPDAALARAATAAATRIRAAERREQPLPDIDTSPGVK